MELPLSTPIVLDGAVSTNLMLKGMPLGKDMVNWLISNPDRLAALEKDFTAAGAQILIAPTSTICRSNLEAWGEELSVNKLVSGVIEITRDAVGKKALIFAGVGQIPEYDRDADEAIFTPVLAEYSEVAASAQAAGADGIFLENFTSIPHMRAAIIAANKTGLPVFVTVTVNSDCETLDGCDVLACLVAAQSLNVKAFGIGYSNEIDDVYEGIKRIYPYAKIPVIAKPNAGQPNPLIPLKYDFSPETMADVVTELMGLGAEVIGGCSGTTPKHLKAISGAVSEFSNGIALQKADEEIIVCNHQQPFFISDDIEISEEIRCSFDMSDDIIEAEEEGAGALCILIENPDDAEMLALNWHMMSLPVLFKCDDEQSLEAALVQYQGRALVDSQTQIPEDSLKLLAQKYGAVIY